MTVARLLALLVPLIIARPLGAAEVDPLIPGNTQVVMTVNLQQLLDSPMGKRLLRPRLESLLKKQPQAQVALLLLGVDPMKDITRVTVALASPEIDTGFLIVTGKFDRNRIANLVERVAVDQKDKLRIHKDGNATVYEIITEERSLYATFASDTTLLVSGDRVKLTDAPKRGKAKKELVTLIDTADGRHPIWLAALPGLGLLTPFVDDTQKELLGQMHGIIGSVKVDTQAQIGLTLVTQNATSSAGMSRLVLDFVELAKLFGPQLAKDQPALAPLLEVATTVRVRAQGKTVTLSADVTADQLDKALALLGDAK